MPLSNGEKAGIAVLIAAAGGTAAYGIYKVTRPVSPPAATCPSADLPTVNGVCPSGYVADTANAGCCMPQAASGYDLVISGPASDLTNTSTIYTATVTQNGQPVPGVDITLVVSGPSGDTMDLPTGPNGTASFSISFPDQGAYTLTFSADV